MAYMKIIPKRMLKSICASTTSISMMFYFPSNEIGAFWYRCFNWEGHPSYALRVMVDGTKEGDPESFQILVDITHVDAPSSITWW